jgi:catechol 2,3-dioxygenase-like lactoylglutathione lyase family enzyme
MPYIGLISLVVANYDDAIAWYTKKLGFDLVEDTDMGDGKRWVIVAPKGARETRILLAQARDDAQRAAIGNQTGGRVALFLNTDDFDRDFKKMQAAGVEFIEAPRHEPYGTVVVFRDLCGNKWDLIQPAA